MVLPTKVYVIVASLGTIAYLAIFFRREIAAASNTICALSPAKKFALSGLLLIAVAYAGTKPTNQVDQTSGTNGVDGTNGEAVSRPLQMVGIHPLRSGQKTASPLFDFPLPPVTDEDLARGWQRLGPFTNDTISYAMPDGAAFATNWWLRGAFEDVTPVSNLWAYVWGKVRFALGDTNEIVAVGAPMSAIPQRSRLWSAADTNGAWFVTWENFSLGRTRDEVGSFNSSGETPLPRWVSAQIELRPNGDYVTRSNEVEIVWRRIDPNDNDGDGYLNDDDPAPNDWTDGAADYYGPANELPWGCNEDAYCDVTVEIGGTQSEWVSFTGDGESDYADPFFYAKPGVPYDVKILIGKTYRVTCDANISAVATSDPDIEVQGATSNAFTVVWPVTITDAPRLFAAPLPGLLGGSHGNTGFQMAVIPSWLDGVFYWTTNTCCQIVDNGGWYDFACEDDCQCGGCEIGGSYTYEGYTIFFSGISCGCHYEPDDNTTFGLTAPSAVFKDGALRPLEINFHHGNTGDPEEGELTLEVVRGNGKIRIWEDAEKTCEASTFSWDVSSFGGCTYYIEGIETSDSVDDILFELTWTRPGGSSTSADATTTCAEVKETQVDPLTAGIIDGSPNQPPFAGHTNWEFNVTHSPNPDKHFSVLFRDAVNDDFSVRDFSVRMTLIVDPAGAPVGTASWFPLDPTPASGSIVTTGTRIGELRNPKVGGVYHIASCFDGSPTNECNIVLPLAGAEMMGVLSRDLAEADGFVSRSRENWPRRWYTRALFASWWFIRDKYGFYRGRPDNGLNPTVWYYNQVNDNNGKGAIGTLFGVPIHIEKLSNLLAAYACEKLDVPAEEQALSQLFGTENDDSANMSWTTGTRLAHGGDFRREVGYLATNAYRSASEKCRKLWPNDFPADNHRRSFGHGDFNVEFSSPGFIYCEQ